MASRSRNFAQLLLILLLLASPGLLPAVTPPLPAHPQEHVVDLAGVLDAGARARLNRLLRDLEAATTAQMVVLTINSLEGQPLEEFSHQTAVKWGIGQKGKDNGVLLTLAVKDRKYRIEVGYGLEGVLPDSLAGSIGRQFLVPHFRKGDFAGGLIAATTEIVRIISRGQVEGQAGGAPGGGREDAPKGGAPDTKSDVPLIVFIIAAIIIGLGLLLFLIPWLLRRATGAVWSTGGSSGGGWSSGGGGSGFSGGGGDFGCGGASGDW